MEQKIKGLKHHEIPREVIQAHIEYKQKAEQANIERKERFNSNAEHQRMKMRTKEERVREAIDKQTRASREYLSHQQGRDVSHSEAEAYARKIAKNALKNDY